jgi:glycosyltransferase involved in cell wall biosynthesis
VVVPWSRLSGRSSRAAGRKPSITWSPVPIPNIVYSARAERLAGYSSRTVVYSVYRISDRADFDIVLDRYRRVPILRRLVPYATFLWSGFTTDIYGFFFDGGLLQSTPWWRVELALLRLAGKRIVVYPYGGDARLASATRELRPWNVYSDVPPGEEERDESQVRARRQAFSRYANVMLGCADIVDLPRLDGIFLYPFDQSEWSVQPERDDQVVTVVHAPNHRELKGTRYLMEAVETLQAEGLAVELQLVEGLPGREAREIYKRADIVADQFLIGAYALFAIEGMALGKPVICFLNDAFRPFHPEWEECPIVSASPDQLVDALRRLVESPERRRELGQKGPGYVRNYHSLESNAARMDDIYRRLWS